MEPMIDRIGGEDKVHELVNHFHGLIETLPQGAAIMDLHLQGHGLSHVRPAQFEFLCGFFGGRRYSMERHNHMSLRDSHAHVPIRPQDATNWLEVMDLALVDCAVTQPMKDQIMATFQRGARMLVNTTE